MSHCPHLPMFVLGTEGCLNDRMGVWWEKKDNFHNTLRLLRTVKETSFWLLYLLMKTYMNHNMFVRNTVENLLWISKCCVGPRVETAPVNNPWSTYNWHVSIFVFIRPWILNFFFSLQPTQVIVAMFCCPESHFPAINAGIRTEFLSLVT
jgi:hypothetical protein